MAKKITDQHGSIVPPLYMSSTYGFNSLADGARAFAELGAGYAYGRMGNPTVTEFERLLARIEGVPEGHVWATNSGLSAVKLLVDALTARQSGGRKRIVTSPYIYGGTLHQLALWRDNHGGELVFVKNPFDPNSWRNALKLKSDFVLLETPSNPTLDVFPIGEISAHCREYDTPLVVDNTIAPVLQRPIEYGADAVIHSVTKALNRQSTGLGGALVGSPDFVKKYGKIIDDYQVSLGTIMHPMTAWLTLNNQFTLEQDMMTFSRHALYLTRELKTNEKVKRINYPFLLSNPGYSIARNQMTGGGGLLSFELESYDAARTFVEALTEVYLAPHLGDSRYLIIHPASTTHAKLSVEEMKKVNITPELVRVSVGLTDLEPILKDFEQAFAAI